MWTTLTRYARTLTSGASSGASGGSAGNPMVVAPVPAEEAPTRRSGRVVVRRGQGVKIGLFPRRVSKRMIRWGERSV